MIWDGENYFPIGLYIPSVQEKLKMNEIVKLQPTKSDVEIAKEFKAKVVEAYKPVFDIIDEIIDAGFQLQVQTGPNAFGKQEFKLIQLVKLF